MRLRALQVLQFRRMLIGISGVIKLFTADSLTQMSKDCLTFHPADWTTGAHGHVTRVSLAIFAIVSNQSLEDVGHAPN